MVSIGTKKEGVRMKRLLFGEAINSLIPNPERSCRIGIEIAE